MKTFAPGVDFGLNLIFDVGLQHYMGYGLSPVSGLKVIITEPYKLPNVLANQYSIGN